ncbi:MAG: DMT family transporter [Sneathiellaceae bacterium]
MTAAPFPKHDRLDRNAVLLLVLLCASWGLYQVSVKVAIEGISPVLQAGLRSAGSTLLLLLWAWHRRIPLFDRDGSLWWGLAAGALFAVEFLLIYLGLTYTYASRGVLFVYMSPFVVALGAHWFIPGERLGLGKLLGLGAAFAGVALAFADGLRLAQGDEWIGDAMCLGGAIAWGATTVLIKGSPLGATRAEKILFYQLAISALALPLVSLAMGEPGIFAATPLVLAALAYQIVLVAFAGYLAWFWLMRSYPASHLSAFTFLTPVFAVLFGVVLLGEPLTLGVLVALALIAVGIWLVNRPPRSVPVLGRGD